METLTAALTSRKSTARGETLIIPYSREEVRAVAVTFHGSKL